MKNRMIAVMVGLTAFAVAIFTGFVYRIPFVEVVLRGLCAFGVGVLIGRIVFGDFGTGILRETVEGERGALHQKVAPPSARRT